MTRRIQRAAILLLSCFASDARTATLATDLEPRIAAGYQPQGADERAIWRNLEQVEKLIRTSPQRLDSPQLEAYTRDVIERLLGQPAPYLRIYLMHDASLNAAMLPSGMMIVNTGLLARVRSEAQFAAVLGHEAGHYFRMHSLNLHRDSRRKAAIATAAAASLHRYGDEHGGWSQINYAVMMSGFRFSRDLEAEADAYGLMLMARAGYRPSAAAEIWGRLVDERRASAAARHRRHRDVTSSALSTHPPTSRRMTNLVDTAESLEAKPALTAIEAADHWAEIIEPFQAMLLREQVNLNDPGASRYLLEDLARDGWTGLLRYYEGELHRLRNETGDDRKAAIAYAAATASPEAPPEAWRARGFASLKAGDTSAAFEALNRYLASRPDAPDAPMIRFTMTHPVAASRGGAAAAGARLTVTAAGRWKKLPAAESQSRWEEVWTWNGPQLDRMAMISGLPDNTAVVARNEIAAQRVPVFRADMTAHDLASMVEVSYRVNGVTVFDFHSIEPVDFLGGVGVRLRYNYVSGIGIDKSGACVMRVVDRKLYALKLESLANETFDAVVPEFDRLVAGARLEM